MSSAPTASQGDAKLELLIRALNGFSLDLLQATLRRSSLEIRIDGPYGSRHARESLVNSDTSLIVAGGSGTSVAWPLVNFFLTQTQTSDAEQTPIRKQKIILIWVIHRSSHLSWLGWPAPQAVADKGVEVIVPRTTVEVGRPDLESVILEIASTSGTESGKRLAVVGSGPDSMGRTVRNTCARLIRVGRNVGVVIEKFGW